jgi:hypothetical protein
MIEESETSGVTDPVVNGNNPYIRQPGCSAAEQGRFVIHAATDSCSLMQAAYVRDEVFRREWDLRLPALPTSDSDESLTLIALSRPELQPVGVVTVVETTHDAALNRRLGLLFPQGARTARYTQLAVLRPYRGLNIPIQLASEAYRRFVAPKGIDYSWLVFNADRAAASSFCRVLGFTPAAGTVKTEYGVSRVLIRNHAQVFNGNSITDAHRSTLMTCNPDEWIAQ